MPLLGCIADDFTGATDLASMLVRHGMRTIQVIGVPDAPLPEADAVVVALKSRTVPAPEAMAQSQAALEALLAAGARQILFKVCSTFDSTDAGNIGPVADTLLRRLQAGFALACPAFPANGRTVYQGHLFVGSRLLSESGMQDHPLTPMRDPDLVRVLSRQTDGGVGLVGFATVEQGAGAIRQAMTRLAESGRRYAILDALTDAHLVAIGEAAAAHPLLIGGSGIAMGLPENFRRAGLLPPRDDADALPPMRGYGAVLAGSCSRATLGQIGFARDHVPVLELDPLAQDGPAMVSAALGWVDGKLREDRPVVIAASAMPDRVALLQRRLGREAAGAMVEEALAAIAAGLVERGVGRLVVAGGETSGAVAQRLGLRSLRIGGEIAPGVPWTFADPPGLHLALKSGNFGGRDMFLRAFEEIG
ncbi:four-carbon acid sugar kinase family protein [Roseomonas gilardii subsp. gilardii]|uniref:3-oxo-tetronate kinase n=1 Tax=Roseomonas gilardii TaxID=257708 RepID=UPI001FF71085|nr:3-oxo-tetronate kinase [Roseomonas gilardii]UPG71104.1 four-carbon acid sugar kinase family protein [Roseomonas gilardii subsp. gilardii]